MKKRIKKWLTFSLAFMLILGSINYSPLTANATAVSQPEIADSVTGNDNDGIPIAEEDVSDETETVSGNSESVPDKAQISDMMRNEGATEEATTRYYTFNDVAVSGGYGYTKEESEAGALSVTFNGQYQEIQYALPEGVDGKTITGITFKLSDTSEGDLSGIALKVLADGTQVDVAYETDTITVSGDLSEAAEITFAIMNKASEAASYAFDYFSITAVQTGGLETPPEAEEEEEEATTRYYTFNDVAVSGGYGYTKEESEAGALSVTFNGQYQEIQYALPEGVDGKTITGITFKLSDTSEGDISGIALKVLADGTQVDVAYETNTITVSGDLSKAAEITFAIMNKASEAASYAFDYFSITAVQTGGLETPPEAEEEEEEATTRYYTFNDVVVSGGYGYTKEESEAGALSVTFNGQYQEIQYALPEGVDGSTLTQITFKLSDTSEGDLSGIALKVLADGTQVDVAYETDTITVSGDLSEAAEITFAIMNKASEAASYAFDYFSITAVQTGGLETPPEAEEEEEEVTTRYYTFNDVAVSGGYGYTKEESEAGALSVTFNGQYQEIQYALPEGVDGSTLTQITFKLSDTSEGDISGIALKVLADGTQVDVAYETDTITVSGDLSEAAEITFAIMNKASEAASYAFDYFSITAVQTGGLETPPEAEEEEPVETYTITVNASALTHDWSATGITNALGADNRLKIDFGVQNSDSRYDLPVTIDLADVESVTFNVCDQDGRHNISLSMDGTKVGDPISNQLGTSFEMVPTATTGTINEVVFQAAGWDYTSSNTLTVESIVFTMKKTADETDQVYGDAPITEEIDPTENITPEGDEDDKRFTYKEDGLTYASSSDGMTYTPQDVEKVAISFTGSWSEIRFNLPEEIELAKCEGVTFAVSEQTVPMSYKLYDADGNEITALTQYSKTGTTCKIAISGRTETVAAVAIMLHSQDVADVNTCVFDGVLFAMNNDLEEEETHTLEYTMDQLELGESNAASCQLVGGNYVMTFSQLNEQVSLVLPATINLENCTGLEVTVSGQTGPVNYYLDLSGTSQKAFYYNTAGQTSHKLAVTELTGGANELRIQCGGTEYTENSGITVEKITFTMKGADGTNDFITEEEPDPTVPGTTNITPAGDGEDDISLQAGTLTVASATSATYQKTDTNQFQVSFASQYNELKLNLPTSVNLLQCTDVTFAVSEQSSPLAFKLYTKDGTVVAKYDNVDSTLYTFQLSRTEEVVAIGVMMNEAGLTDQTCVFDGVTFTMDTSLSTETEMTEFSAAELTPGKTQNATYTVVNGEYVIDFSAVNSEIWFTLPETINMSQCISVIFEVEGQTEPLNFHVGREETKLKSYWYNTGADTYTLEALCKDQINQVCIQLGNNMSSGTVTLKNVSFLMREGDGEVIVDPEDPTETVEGTPNITPAGEYSYQAGELTVSLSTTAEYVKTTTNQYQVTFPNQYREMKLTLPEAIDLLQCSAVTFAVTSQTAPLAFKLYNEKNEEIFVKYDQSGSQLYTFDVSSTEKVKYVGVMLNQNLSDAACVFDGVMFDVDPNATTDTYTITYAAHELTLDSSEAESCELANGNWMIKFSNMDQNVNFKLPASVNLEKCVNIIFTVATQNGPVNFNVSLDKTKLKDYWYNTGKTVYTLEPGVASKINEVGVQCGRENDAYVSGSFIELVSVSFLMKGTEPKETPADGNYTMDYFDINDQSTGVSQVLDEQGTATITFPKKGDSITYEIPDSVDVNHLTSMEFLQSLKGVKVNLLNAKGNVLISGTDSVIATNCNPEIKYIQLVSLANNTVLTLDSIKFNVDPNAYEAIVLNGNFAREDVSMWGAALWGSVDGVSTEITVKTSDTPIYENIYTYGEINRRSSPYVCFAQNVTDRTTPAKGYIFSFWAKLSDDYAGAPAELRTVEFSPYYLDVNGNAQYSMTRTGAYKQVLEPGVWTHFYGVVGLPDGATGFIIRIVEQGTNYGQGECLMGSYAVTGVSLTPTDYPPEPSWGKGGGSGTRNNTVTKEATYEVTYTKEDLAIDWASATTKSKSGNLNISFTNNYDEVRLKLPRTLDMSTCAWIKVSIPEQNVPIAVKLYYKGQQVDVVYYNDISASYLMVPVYDGMIDGIGIMSLATPNPTGAYALFEYITFGLTQEPAPVEVSDTIVINGDFADADMSDWSAALWGNGITITQKTSSTPIYGDTYTYATYSRRTSPYQCFAQDITGRVEQNETYTFSFWAKLSDDYKGAPDVQRVVQFAPYTVDKDGNADYNPRLDGTYAQVMEPGIWYYFEGTYKVTNDNPISKVVIRILEQGTNYGQGDCVMGSYSVAGVQMEKYIPEPPSIDEDVPDLKDAMAETFGDDFITGTAITVSELDDIGVEMLINKHFNAVTIGNELKPDALFNYSNDEHTPLQTITFNGVTMEVPTLYFNRAEEILDKLLEWNESNPDNQIKVRGHVLVWHSQTPEWFFREGYTVGQNADGSENYVTPEEMNLRLEWYIKTVLEHFTGEDSPYKDMFYGWDVVNEAVSNGGTGYRTDKVSAVEPLSQSTHSSNSSWWAVYQSNEYILNAFRYANQYAPADVELYYNDYNECDTKKMQGIVRLLTDVKEAEGTRIDGMGMQGHYNMFNPSVSDIETAVRAYAEVVGKVQYTELDMKVSGDISTDAALEKEYIAQAERYHDIYMVLKKLDAEDGIEISGITMWGTVDKYSWLQSSSDVGGGADGTLSQCPLLFDSNYKVKPSYWAFVDYTMVDPDWTEEAEEEPVKEQEETPAEETPESASEPEAEPVAEPEPVVTETKSSPIVPIAIAVGAVVIAAGAGAAVYFGRKKSGAGKKSEK